MVYNNLKFKAISLNVRGIRAFEKRKAIFSWLISNTQFADICYLQETYSTNDMVNHWNNGLVNHSLHAVLIIVAV